MMAGDSRVSRPLVLVVDDDFSTRLLVGEALEQAGFRVVSVEDGEQALASFKEQQPDLLITDAMMPRLDGFALCAELRRRPDSA
jgi:CheY-like chemotaxis protein